MLQFPEGFTWGVSTAAYQIEGATHEDGRSPSVWDTYVHESGRIAGGVDADVAADSYHRWPEDIRCMNELGVGAYRFSLAWPRIIPSGRGEVNPRGIEHYDALIDALLENGIEPWVCLYHWDLPQVLQDRGGWQSRETADVFAEYAGRCVEAFGDRVQHWVTFNEIHAFVDQGYGGLWKAPGLDLDARETAQVYHNVLLGHGKAVAAMRAVRQDVLVGMAENPQPRVPVVETAENIRAAELAWDAHIGRLFGPVFHGAYPDLVDPLPDVQDGDMEIIQTGLDVLGLNFYTGCYVEATDEAPGFRLLPWPDYHPHGPGQGWLRHIPEAVYWGVRLGTEKYDPPAVCVMENGYPLPPDRPEEEDMEDVSRIMFVRNYLDSLHRAIEDGYPVSGYFYWTLMDCFEWIGGYTSLFGLYKVDFETQERIPRLSARWYSEVVRRNALV